MTARRTFVLAIAGFIACARPAHAADFSIDGGRLVSIVTADIDAHGDLDVVASDTALQLHVWVNDGSGHFTRQRPRTLPAWQPVPPAPALDGTPFALPSFAPANPPSLENTLRVVAASLDVTGEPLLTQDQAACRSTRASCAPRAPPAFAR
jgi:hypothetical protein